MTVYTTDFSEYTTGDPLSDWSDFWASGNFTYLAQANSGTFKVGTKECNYLIGSNGRGVLTWDDIGSVNDSDIIVKANANTFTTSDGVRVYSRVSGSSGAENAYFLLVRSGYFTITQYLNGAASTLGQIVFTYKANTNYWMRFQTTGTTLRAKIWAEDSPEPSDWKITITSPSLSSGRCGFGAYDATVDYEVDYFSCGTGTDSAVFPPSGYDLLDKFGFVGDATTDAAVSATRAMGGQFTLSGKQLTGVRLYCPSHNDDARVGVYSGGNLATGLNTATLLCDFGKTSGTDTGYIELSCTPVDIPQNAPLWIAVKGDNAAGFGFSYITNSPANSGNFQVARGRCDINAIIGNDPDVAFPSIFADTNGVFGTSWYDWNILYDDAAGDETITADAGTLVITGSDADLIPEKFIDAEAGAFIITGSDADLIPSSEDILTADAGTLVITGSDADLIPEKFIDAEAGALVITGSDADLIIKKFLDAEAGTFAITGSDADLIPEKFIDAEAGALVITGGDVTLHRIIADAGAFAITGTDMTFAIGTGPAPPGQIVYLFTLTGAPDSTTDIEIPMKSFQARLRSGQPTYLQIVLPGMAYVTQINARSNGVLEIDLAYLLDGEYTQRETIIQANLEDISIYKGANNTSISLTGHKQKTFSKKAIELTGATYKNTLNGVVRYRLARPNVYLNPGDSVTIDSDTFDANVISFFVSAGRTIMELSEE